MIRKQLYITVEEQKKLHALAAAWGCTEAEVMRRAIDRLPAAGSLEDRLRAAGLLVEPPDDPDLPPPEEVEALEREWDEIVRSLPEPLNLSQTVIENRGPV